MSKTTPVSRVDRWLKHAVGLLEASGVPSARLDALILLEDATDKERGWLLAHPEFNLTGSDLVKLNQQIERRANHEPLAYIRGKSEFYGREFRITPATLQPRSETETMLELLFELVGSRKSEVESIVDVGTGSGCLAITSNLEWPELEVYATEINYDALEVAQENAKNLGADVKFFQGNLLEPILFHKRDGRTKNETGADVLLCNLPYVPDSHTINEAAMQEPKVAIFGGKDGLDLYQELFDQITTLKTKPKYILTESLPFQHQNLEEIANESGYNLKDSQDFIQLFVSS